MNYLETARKALGKTSQARPSTDASERKIVAYSRVLGRDIVISWRGDEPRVIYVDRTLYTAEEIAGMDGAGPEAVRDVHLLKEDFDGELG